MNSMKVIIIGYSWCPHFENACSLLKEQNTKLHIISLDMDTNKDILRTFLLNQIGHRHVEGSFGETSPQIIALEDDMAVCLGGESELLEIGDVRQYVQPIFQALDGRWP